MKKGSKKSKLVERKAVKKRKKMRVIMEERERERKSKTQCILMAAQKLKIELKGSEIIELSNGTVEDMNYIV